MVSTIFIFNLNPTWEMIQFDYYFSNGLKPPTSVEIPYLVGKIEFDLNFYHSALWLNIEFRKFSMTRNCCSQESFLDPQGKGKVRDPFYPPLKFSTSAGPLLWPSGPEFQGMNFTELGNKPSFFMFQPFNFRRVHNQKFNIGP